ncbi:MAG: FimV/HubP family polar landmark protein, partial [Burkholderiaceae bacterium]
AKLAEIYSGRKDVKAFETVAREMHEMTGGANEEWPKVVTMGLSLDPGNPLYGGGAGGGDPMPSPGVIAAGAAAVAAASASAAASHGGPGRHDLDFPDMQMGSPPAAEPTPAARDDFRSELAAHDDDIPSLDFDLSIDTRIDQAASEDGAEIRDTMSGPDMGSMQNSDLSAALDDRFDLPSLDLDPKPSGKAGALDLDLPALESLTQTGMQQAADLDLSPISLDLEPATVGAEAEASAGGAGRWQEMATKLDLASAYEEIGDKEGARELLQEVINGGDSGQQQKARAMLSKIG